MNRRSVTTSKSQSCPGLGLRAGRPAHCSGPGIIVPSVRVLRRQCAQRATVTVTDLNSDALTGPRSDGSESRDGNRDHEWLGCRRQQSRCLSRLRPAPAHGPVGPLRQAWSSGCPLTGRVAGSGQAGLGSAGSKSESR